MMAQMVKAPHTHDVVAWVGFWASINHYLSIHTRMSFLKSFTSLILVKKKALWGNLGF